MNNFVVAKNKIKNIFSEYVNHNKKSDYRISILLGVVMVAISLLFNHFANSYVDSHVGAYVSDMLLDNIPVFDVNFMVNEGVWIFTFFACLFIFANPKKIPFFLKSFATFIFVRSLFIMLTHLGPMPQHSYLNPNDYLSWMAGGDDMFFSGHTGVPFLIALVFWENKFVRNFYLIVSVIFGTTMILGHLHYSIDVFSAFFITYGIFKMSQEFFAKDYELAN